ncbi:MAG TPA: hypothetical protein VN026_16180 [Bacteroidia bacterium]|jgi:hypothetical protein|nr:hypothetical protein [Bacteroidia bacterium]
MKTIKTQILAITLLLVAVLFTECKKGETGPAGAAGPQGSQGPVLTLINSGNVTGTLTGTRRDGTAFTEPFSYAYYLQGSSGTLDSLTSSLYVFSMQRSINDIFSNNSASINVNAASKTASTGTLNLSFTFEKSLSSTKLFSFSGNTSTATATSLSYNATTGLFSGNFNVTLTGTQNNTGNTATIIGNFQANLIQKIYRKTLQSQIKTD